MSSLKDNPRRTFVIATSVAAGAVLTSTTGCTMSSSTDRQLVYATLDEAMRETDRLVAIAGLKPDTVWSLPQTLVHCAQSIEYSMRGFPEAKSAIFQRTVGSAAFGVFSWRGRMSHDLSEAIPGAPVLDAATDINAALTRLQKAVSDFRASSEPMQAHFAYGSLTKAQYEQAHAMHLANHFSAIDA